MVPPALALLSSRSSHRCAFSHSVSGWRRLLLSSRNLAGEEGTGAGVLYEFDRGRCLLVAGSPRVTEDLRSNRRRDGGSSFPCVIRGEADDGASVDGVNVDSGSGVRLGVPIDPKVRGVFPGVISNASTGGGDLIRLPLTSSCPEVGTRTASKAFTASAVENIGRLGESGDSDSDVGVWTRPPPRGRRGKGREGGASGGGPSYVSCFAR
jgi:hypothetical protein